VRQHHFQADQMLANRPQSITPRATPILLKDVADGEALWMRRIDGKPLASFAQLSLETAQCQPCLNSGGEVLRVVFQDTSELVEGNSLETLPGSGGFTERGLQCLMA